MRGVIRICRGGGESPVCLGSDWYDDCITRIAKLEREATLHGDLDAALASWCDLCAAVADALNHECVTMTTEDVGYLSARPIAAWLLRRRYGRIDKERRKSFWPSSTAPIARDDDS